jgi:hypothetical protein
MQSRAIMYDSDGYPNIAIVGALILLGVIGTFSLATGAVRVAAAARSRSDRGRALLAAAMIVTATGLSVYTWGVMHLTMDETQADSMCKAAVENVRAGNLSGYHTSLLPLRFQCLFSDGAPVATAVPGRVNAVLAVIASVAVTLTAFSLYSRYRGRMRSVDSRNRCLTG